MRRPLRCLVGWHRWIDLNAFTVTVLLGNRPASRACSRCGLVKH